MMVNLPFPNPTSRSDAAELPVVIYGAGTHGAVLYEVLRRQGANVLCFVDDRPQKSTLFGIPVLNAHELDETHSIMSINRRDFRLIAGMGGCKSRRMVASSLRGGPWVHAIDPSAVFSESASLGEGSVIFQSATVQARAKIGNHVIINTAASIDHDCTVGDFAHVAPNATVCGGVSIGDCAHIGAGSTVIQNIQIGENAVVGAGAVVVRDVLPNTQVVGVPARVVRTLCVNRAGHPSAD